MRGAGCVVVCAAVWVAVCAARDALWCALKYALKHVRRGMRCGVRVAVWVAVCAARVKKDFFVKRYINPFFSGSHVPFLVWHHFHPIKIGPLISLGYLILSKSVDLDGILANYLCNNASFCHLTSCQPVVLHIFISDYIIRSDKRYK